MENQLVAVSKLPYKGLKKAYDLIHVDRSILSLFINNKKEYFILYLIDSIEDYDELLLWKVTREDLYAFLFGKLSFKSLIISDSKDFIFLLHSDYYNIDDFDDFESYNFVLPVELSEVENDWLPETDSYYNFPVPEQLRVDLQEIEYLEKLRENAKYFTVEPRSGKYGSTVSSLDAATFLSRITSSFLSFATYDLKEKFANLFSDIIGLQSSEEQLKSSLIPRVAYAGFGSFEVALSVDTLNPALEGNETFFNWQRQIIDIYKSEVIDLDYESIEQVEAVLAKYPPAIRRQIFKPLFDLADNPHFTVAVSNKATTVAETIYPVARDTRRRITVSNDEVEKDEDEKSLEIMTVTMTVPEGSDLDYIDKHNLKKSYLSVTKSNTVDDTYNETFTFKGTTFQFKNPLKIKIATRGLYIILLCDVFSIEVSSDNRDQVFRNLQEEIYNYYLINVANNPHSPEAKTFAIYIELT